MGRRIAASHPKCAWPAKVMDWLYVRYPNATLTVSQVARSLRSISTFDLNTPERQRRATLRVRSCLLYTGQGLAYLNLSQTFTPP